MTTTDQQQHLADTVDHLSSIKQFPIPVSVKVLNQEKASARLDQAITDYREKRDELAKANETLEKLRKTHRALVEQSKAAEKAWKQDFMSSHGKQSKSVLEQQKQQADSRIQAEQHEDMIRLLEPKVEQLQLLTAFTRQTYESAAQAAKEVHAYSTLLEKMQELATVEPAQAVRDCLEPMFEHVAIETYNDPLYMAQFGVDTSKQLGRGFLSHLNREETQQIKHDIEQRQLAAIGALFLKLVPLPHTSDKQQTVIPPLSCEIPREAIQNKMATVRRLKELEAALASVSA
ncbi:hypothetical protein KUW18_09105 [Halomonas sp. DP5Y7-2]|uniref:hypothetical protein n=1 Tax=Halomonas sp. DP5Y7-2 TaxID=2859076 RepID=UPI001C995E34|nr:hypothetical protein [Halomonas sp. DP5Y7-2]MBY5984248.1 hypothetical protein [Halomonas sp. DP5Y7-2]